MEWARNLYGDGSEEDRKLVGVEVLDRNLYGDGSIEDRNYDGGGDVGDRNLVVCVGTGNLGEWEDDRLSFVTGFSDESNLSELDLSSSDVGQHQSSSCSLCFSGGIDEEDQIEVPRGRPVAATPSMNQSLSRKLVEANESVQNAFSSGVIFRAKDLQHECGDHRPSRSIFEKAVKLETALSRGIRNNQRRVCELEETVMKCVDCIKDLKEKYVDLLALKLVERKKTPTLDASTVSELPFRIGTLQELKAEQELDELYQMPNESIHAFSVKVMELVQRANRLMKKQKFKRDSSCVERRLQKSLLLQLSIEETIWATKDHVFIQRLSESKTLSGSILLQ
uniref:Uncharacterized protein n=1 Tax=Ditylenchus dipsaci TaxID=166011 RepID=A0A915CLM4_9BILA